MKMKLYYHQTLIAILMSEDNGITYLRYSKKNGKRKFKQRILFSAKLLSSIKDTNKVINIMNSGNIIPMKTS